MARVKITEYRAKKVLLGDAYRGIATPPEIGGVPPISGGRWVAKVDEGVKKRAKQGLVAADCPPTDAQQKIAAWKKKGFTRFLIEPFIEHKPSEERYVSLERVRGGLLLMYSRDGGVNVEEYPKKITTCIIKDVRDTRVAAKKTGIPKEFLEHLVSSFDEHFFAFCELNPFLVRGRDVVVLDAAVLVDSTGAYFTDLWSEADMVEATKRHPAEMRTAELAKTTPASLKLSVLNENGSLFFLLSGGGGSIVIVDEAVEQRAGKDVGNYGEYSGGPTREETYLYAREVIALLLASEAKKKAFVIAGGVANFTDVAKTFAGAIDALAEHAEALRKQGVKVFVRRGGPNEKEGLSLMRDFLKRKKLLGAVYGSDNIITSAIEDALGFVKKKS